MSPTLRVCLLVSLLLHLFAAFVADQMLVKRETDVLRVRLATPPRFTPPPRPQTARPSLPRVAMEYRPTYGQPTTFDEAIFAGPDVSAIDAAELPGQLGDEPGEPKATGPQLDLEDMPSPTIARPADTVASQRLDLLRIEDMLRAGKERAVVIPDPDSVRATRGFIRFTPVYLDGAWSYVKAADAEDREGRPILEDLARYLRDHTGIHADIRSTPVRAFRSTELLRDPVHFLFPGLQQVPYSDPRVRLAPEERALLSDYLHGGGFLFVDAGQTSDDRRFLTSVVDLLQQVLAGEGRLYELPVDHPVYHAFYDYANGFPGECKEAVVELPFGSAWYYPDRAPDGDACPRGMWGIGLGDQLVGVISDLNLHRRWDPRDEPADASSSDDAETEAAPVATRATIPFLQAGTNILFHALLRPEGLTIKHALPAWQRTGTQAARARVPGQMSSDQPAQLALVRSPVGRVLEGDGLRLTVDGRITVEAIAAHAHGLLLHDLPAGRYRIEVDYASRQTQADVELRGGRVTTVSFRLRGFGFLQSLALEQMEQRLDLETWQARFGELYLEEATAGEPFSR